MATKKTAKTRKPAARPHPESGPAPEHAAAVEVVADVWGTGIMPKVLGVVASVYLASILFDGMGSTLPHRTLPQAAEFFAQCACLFPKASEVAIDYRAEGFRCSDQTWVEIDPRPFFPIDRDEKESRFQRTMHFYREDRPTMQALEDFMIERQNAVVSSGGAIMGGGPIGGVRFLSLRVPIGKPGESLERYEHKPLAEYPSDERHEWYYTSIARREARCKP